MKRTRLVFFCAAIWLLLCLPTRAAEHPAYLHGFPDGSLQPGAVLTREQLAAIVCRLLPSDVLPDAPPRVAYVDLTPRRWSYDAVCAAVALGLWSDVRTPHFAPQQPVTGQELYAVLQCAGTYLPALAEAVPPDDPAAECTREAAARIINALLGRTEAQFADAAESAVREAATHHTAEHGAWLAVG